MIELLLKSPRWFKKLLFILHDGVLIFASFFLALILETPLHFTHHFQDYYNWLVLILTLTFSLPTFISLGLYRTVLRYTGEEVLTIVLKGVLISVAILAASVFYASFNVRISYNVQIVYGLSLIVCMVLSRFVIRGLLSSKVNSNPVIIYGAGESGRQLLMSIRQVDDYYPVAFVDDDPKVHGTLILDRPVHDPKKLPRLVSKYKITNILIAMPSASQAERKKVLEKLKGLHCDFLIMPGLKDLVEGKLKVSALKKVSVLDLLRRDQVDPNQDLMQKDITDKVVMVSGAGGSIGSELCRQIIKQSPKMLVLFELSEFSLYSIEKELSELVKSTALDIEVIPVLGSVRHQDRLTQLMSQLNVDTVYHAAAYKHVPLVEYNTIEGVKNNIFGTLNCAMAAVKAKVPTFVLISTDKAVRPTNTMGASKRMAELVLQGLAKQQNTTRFCMVRFGNVLGSSGSVIPLFERQIEAGGPITVTHEDITRFFMTIPEAAQLVIQAGAMGKGGDVFLLDMGEPVKIIDLAKQMIHLSGLKFRDEDNPDGDIEIKVTGLRPGEKLYEELLIGASPEETSHPRIMSSKEKMLYWSELQPLLSDLQNACLKFDPKRVREILLEAPTDFAPSDDLSDILIKYTK